MKFLMNGRSTKVIALVSAFALVIGGSAVFAGKGKSKKLASAKSTQVQAYIGEEAAKAKAFEFANAAAADVSKVKVELESDDGIMEYDVEFAYNGYKYDVDINALTGEKMEFSKKLIRNKKPVKPPAVTKPVEATSYIGYDAAKKIALDTVGAGANDVYALKVELDREKGVMIYEVEFDYNGYEYEFDIDAKTGKVIKWDKDYDDDAYKHSYKSKINKAKYDDDDDDDDDDDRDDD